LKVCFIFILFAEKGYNSEEGWYWIHNNEPSEQAFQTGYPEIQRGCETMDVLH